MSTFEYRIVPAPRRPKKVRGAKTPQERYAAMLTETVNAEARAGWEFVRAESLPMEEKKGMLSSPVEAYHSYLVFRRAVGMPVAAQPQQPAPAPAPMTAVPPPPPQQPQRPVFPLMDRNRAQAAPEQAPRETISEPRQQAYRAAEPRPPEPKTTETPFTEPRFKFQPPNRRRDEEI